MRIGCLHGTDEPDGDNKDNMSGELAANHPLSRLSTGPTSISASSPPAHGPAPGRSALQASNASNTAGSPVTLSPAAQRVMQAMQVRASCCMCSAIQILHA